MMPNKIGIVGIDTGVGKTIVSAIVTEALKADYWKIIQAGDLIDLDSDTVNKLLSNKKTKIHPEAFLLSEPMSPHQAANIDGISIVKADFKLPELNNDIVIEGAGGIMVPYNNQADLLIDVMKDMVDEVIVVSKHYLGSINHTLLTIAQLNHLKISIKGIVFVGETNMATESIILKQSDLKCLLNVPITDKLDQAFIIDQADKFRERIISL